jgi:hypothetical protein
LLQSDKEVENIACRDNRLYIQGYLRSDKERFEHYTVIYEDTLWNFNAQTQLPARETPFVLSYNLDIDSIDYYWKFGSDGVCRVIDMATDKHGDLVVGFESDWATWFNFNHPDTIRSGKYSGDYLLKFKSNGELVFAKEQPIALAYIQNSESGYFIQITLSADTGPIDFNGDTISLCKTSDDEYGLKSYLLKFDFEGNLLWPYVLEGCSNGAELLGFDDKNGVVSCSYKILDPELEIQGRHYSKKGKYLGIVNLDSETGESIGHYLTNEESEYTGLQSSYLEALDNNRFRSIIWMRYGSGYYTFPLGDLDGDISYFVDFELDMLTNSEDVNNEGSAWIVYPNPASKTLHFQNLSTLGDSYQIRILDNYGKIIRQEFFNNYNSQAILDIGNVSPGIYFYEILTAKGMQESGKVVVE